MRIAFPQGMTFPRRQRCRIVRQLSILTLGTVLIASAQTTAGPVVSTGGVVNAADYTAEMAPGMMVSVFGTNLASTTTAASAVPLPKSLNGVTVEMMETGGAWNAVPLYFISSGQINIQVPFFTTTALQLRVRNSIGTSPAVAVTLVARAPRIFTRTQDGKGEPTLFHSKDYSWVSAAAPAVPGEYLVLLLTGLGAVAPTKEAGSPGGDNATNGPLNYVPDPVYVSFGGVEVQAAFAGLMPGFPGVYQVNLQVPDAIPAGLQTLKVRSGTGSSQVSVAAYAARYGSGAVTNVISPAGGSVTTTGAAVTFPAGAYAEPTTVAISQVAAPTTPVEASRVSNVYTLYGLPAVLTAPVTVTLNLTKPVGSQTLIAMNSGPGVRGSGLEFLEASVSGSQATVTLPVDAGASAVRAATATTERSAASGPEVSLYVMTFYRSVTVGDFLLFYPSDTVQESAVTAVGNTLQTAKSQLSALGLSWDRRTRWPMRVVIYPFTGGDVDKWGMAEPSILGLNYHSISINASKVSSGVTDDLKATVGHELFHILQNLYDPRDAFRIAKSPGSWLWFQEAASAWFESIAIGAPSSIPAIVEQDNYAFLSRHGLEYQPGDPSAVQNHGYGASMFLHYLADHAGGNTVVGSILKQSLFRAQGLLAESLRWPTEAAASVLPGQLAEHWRNFVIAYAEGTVYGRSFPDHGQILSQLKDRLVFATEATDGKTFGWDAPALSAAFYTARFQAWPKDVKLNISLVDPGGDAQLSIYRARGDTWTLVTKMRAGEYDFPLPEELVANAETLVLVVANANGSGRYTGTTAIQVGVNKKIDSIVPLLNKTSKFQHHFYGVLTYNDANGTGAALLGPLFGLPGVTWSGTKFSATAEDSALVNPGEPPFQVTLTGSLSADGLKILNAHYRRYRLLNRDQADATGRIFKSYDEDTDEWDISSINVIVPSTGFTAKTTSFRYEVTGAATNAAVSGFVCTRNYYSGLASDFKPEKVKTSSCTVSFPAEDRYYTNITFYQ